MIKYAVKYIKNTFVPLKCPDNVNLDDGVLILARTEKGEEALKAFLVNKDLAKHFEASNNPDFSDPLYVYGTDADEIRNLVASSPAMAEKLHPDYAYTVGEVTWLVRNEMPRTLEDVLARRLRILFLDARAAMAMAPKVAGILATEWGKDETWTSAQVKAFNEVASNYILN